MGQHLTTYAIDNLLIDEDYVLSDYSITADTLIGFDLTGATPGACVYFKVTANGTNKITFNSDSVRALTGINNYQILPPGKYTLIGVFNGENVDVSLSEIGSVLKPVTIPSSGLKVLFDFLDLSTITVDTGAYEVQNLASPNYFLTQANPDYQPSINSEGLVFDGVDDFMSSNIPSSLMSITGDYTLFIVYKNYTPIVSSNKLVLYENSSSLSGFHVANIQSGVLKQGYYKATPGFVCKSINSAIGVRHVDFFESIAGSIAMELDGTTATGTSTIATGLGITNGFQLGANGDAKSSFFKGSVEKIVIYDRQLNTTEKNTVLAYLA